MAITQVITPLPPAPDISTDTPTIFNAKAVAHVQAQSARDPQIAAWTAQANATAAEVNTNATAASGSAASASQKASEAAQSAATAAALAATAAQAAAASKWVSGSSYTEGNAVWSPADFRTYRRKTNGAGTTDPSVDSTNWAPMAADTASIRRERTSNAALAIADNRCEIVFTSGTFTQTISACATLGNGWTAVLVNDGTGIITLDPSGSEAIDGQASIVMLPGEARRLQCDGTALHSVVLRPFHMVYTSTAAFPKPTGYKMVGGRMWGGGRPGQKASYSAGNGWGGIGGNYVPFTVEASKLSSSTTVAVAAATPSGSVAGESSFGSHISTADTAMSEVGGPGGTASIRTPANRVYSGAGGGIGNDGQAETQGATSKQGGSGGNGGATGMPGTAGAAPGGGGGGAGRVLSSEDPDVPGGTGARGEVQVWGIA